MGLSSDSLTHFTPSFKSLERILIDTFKVNYCRETVCAQNGKFDILVPQVSFCDIPFSQIVEHVRKYGGYGIGLSKKWAHKRGLNPVLYVEKNSNLANSFFRSFLKTILKDTKNISQLSPTNKANINILRYMKNFQGDLEREGKKTKKDYRFANEREWRYVLPLDSTYPMLVDCRDKPNSNVKQKKDELNNNFFYRLSFGPDDINYIIIKYERQRDMAIKAIKKIKDVNHDPKTVARLISRIISVEQIKIDF